MEKTFVNELSTIHEETNVDDEKSEQVTMESTPAGPKKSEPASTKVLAKPQEISLANIIEEDSESSSEENSAVESGTTTTDQTDENNEKSSTDSPAKENDEMPATDNGSHGTEEKSSDEGQALMEISSKPPAANIEKFMHILNENNEEMTANIEVNPSEEQKSSLEVPSAPLMESATMNLSGEDIGASFEPPANPPNENDDKSSGAASNASEVNPLTNPPEIKKRKGKSFAKSVVIPQEPVIRLTVRRIGLILAHRGEIGTMFNLKDGFDVAKHTAKDDSGCVKNLHIFPPGKRQKAPRYSKTLTPITLKQMANGVDKIYKDRYIEFDIIEDALLGFVGIGIVIQDENGDVERGIVYCVDHSMGQEQLGFGRRITVMNPYMRKTREGPFFIRVDDPKSIIFRTTESDLRRCRFCLKPNARKCCPSCKFAMYCGKECHKNDWNIMNHEFICKVLAKSVNPLQDQNNQVEINLSLME